MSEPVIKAKAWVCADCGSTWSIGDRNGEYCCSRDKKIEEAYTRDDLVRAVEASRQMVWVSLSYDKDPEIVFEETPEQVVDRLTKGET